MELSRDTGAGRHQRAFRVGYDESYLAGNNRLQPYLDQGDIVRFHGILMFVMAALGCLVSLQPLGAQPAIRSVNCDAGDTIRAALPGLRPGDTLVVRGTCNEGVTIPPEMANVTFEGDGTANIRSPGIGFQVLGRAITIRGFDITAVRNGINVLRGGTAIIDGNTIHDTGGSGLPGTGLGINVAQNAFASMVNNTIRNNANVGIFVQEASGGRIGYTDVLETGLPNIIWANGYGIRVSRTAIASIVGATIIGNRMDGIHVERAPAPQLLTTSPRCDLNLRLQTRWRSQAQGWC